MAALIFDIDGTLVIHGTNELLPGALDMLKELTKKGHQIILTTRRGDDYPSYHIYGRRGTEEFLERLKGHGINVLTLIFNVDSPRLVINDQGVGAFHHSPNEEWQTAEVKAIIDRANLG